MFLIFYSSLPVFPSGQGLTGPRAIEHTIRQKLPEGFQSSEFLLEHGLMDLVVSRKNLNYTVSRLLDYLS